ncbi:Oidioi.mRNA.OKI2018_I69.chr2.g6525.t1.cds [Oikopleura dioica]|uniref:Oidioi.mRNA.OKI2018_I69.chr2.g6525.t1.cds n=1 Tax=Oikopleura dioica TaxID=34765 RepID=A0ABN7T842_OIKDI|nr:Oidioi.mRNA.OKI2018_I69.chr2.g6525.t1.cds [Oikopleura dioica]
MNFFAIVSFWASMVSNVSSCQFPLPMAQRRLICRQCGLTTSSSPVQKRVIYQEACYSFKRGGCCSHGIF